MEKFRSVKKPLLSDEVARQLMEAIVSGSYKPADKLPSERELCQQFEVSRVTVRESLRRLQSQGVIDIKRGVHAGAYVSEPNPQGIIQNLQMLIELGKVDFGHLIEARLFLEPDVAKSAAIYRKAEDIERVKELLREAESLINTSKMEARFTNVRFHCELAKITRNPIMMFFCESIIQIFSHTLIKQSHQRLDRQGIQKLIEEHHHILEAVIAKQPEEAYERAKDHLLETYRMYERIIPNQSHVNRSLQYYDRVVIKQDPE